MNRICFLMVLVFVFTKCKTTIAEDTTPQDSQLAQEIKPVPIPDSEIANYVNFLADDALLGRDTGSEGLEKAAQYIESAFRDYGIAPYFETYRDDFKVKGIQTQNIVGFLKGTDPDLAKEFMIIGAHYDHIGSAKQVEGDVIANGANDNAAGSAAVLALAKYFAKANANKRSVLFVLFAAEEKGLLGSKHLASKLKGLEIDLYAMVNFEMIGVPLKGKPYMAYITGYNKSNMAAKFNEYSGVELIGFLPKAKEFHLFQRSDNYSFYKEFKVPSQTISTFDFTNYDYYHHVDDETSKLDFIHMARLINNCIPPLKNVLNTPAKEIKLN